MNIAYTVSKKLDVEDRCASRVRKYEIARELRLYRYVDEPPSRLNMIESVEVEVYDTVMNDDW